MYQIIIEYYYYRSALDYPISGRTLTDVNEEPYTFQKWGDAIAFLESNGITLNLEPKVYCHAGTYMLRDGEYARPTYTIVKVEEE